MQPLFRPLSTVAVEEPKMSAKFSYPEVKKDETVVDCYHGTNVSFEVERSSHTGCVG